MKKERIKSAPWYPYAVAICIGVVLFVFLTRFPSIWNAFMTFIGFFKPVIYGCIIAYIVNPLSEVLFKAVKNRKVANILSFVLVLLILVFAVLILIPQLVQSGNMFAANLDGYVAAASQTLQNMGIGKETLDLEALYASSGEILSGWVKENTSSIIAVSGVAGKSIMNLALGFILAIYLLSEKKNLKTGAIRFLDAWLGEEKSLKVQSFFRECDRICNRYIVFNILDSVIVGCANALFMLIFGMEYVGLVSFVVGVTNLIPNFGPVIGLVVGGFVLLMVNPVHALIFLIFTLILQALDGYVLKPKLFGDTLGVSGLWILVGVIVGGNMFGVVGILIAIPVVAIVDFAFKTCLLPTVNVNKKPKTV
ncbi:MAG: AI-2E family transporter [Sphaerochaetaceae bacterium]|nr:AI-2E family transporter [Sphaerochaetaceae bacterium]